MDKGQVRMARSLSDGSWRGFFAKNKRAVIVTDCIHHFFLPVIKNIMARRLALAILYRENINLRHGRFEKAIDFRLLAVGIIYLST
jgi:hypothetical protein